jgi:DNA-binding Lrp family transcriptional regulator
MAVKAYVLIDCTPGEPHDVVDALTKLAGIETAHAVTGSYDVIVFLRVESMAALGNLLSRQIQRLPGILKTTTHVVVERPTARDSGRSKPARRA